MISDAEKVKEWIKLKDLIYEINRELDEAQTRKERLIDKVAAIEKQLTNAVGRNTPVKMYVLDSQTAVQVRWFKDQYAENERFENVVVVQ